jgi:hypothetical protein
MGIVDPVIIFELENDAVQILFKSLRSRIGLWSHEACKAGLLRPFFTIQVRKVRFRAKFSHYVPGSNKSQCHLAPHKEGTHLHLSQS